MMPDRIGVFVLATFILVTVPGPDVLYITARSIDQGRIAGLVSAAAAATGVLVLTIGAALGLSAILASSAVAFSIVKYAGAAYLIYLGLRRLLSRADREDARTQIRRASLRRVFAQGFLIAVLNPKTALFFVAFLPQFVDRAHGSIRLQLIVLGLILAAIGLCTDSGYALLSGTVGKWLARRRGPAAARRYAVGGTYLALGVGAAVTRST